MKENENANNQDDAMKDTVNPDIENQQEPAEEQPQQEKAAEAKETSGDKVSDKKSKRFKIRHAAEKALEETKSKLAELNDKHLRLQAEFDNFRKRTAKEKLDLTVTASENVIKDILPVLDDFERALQNMEKNGNESDIQGVTKLVPTTLQLAPLLQILVLNTRTIKDLLGSHITVLYTETALVHTPEGYT